jgi:hypothetical protein
MDPEETSPKNEGQGPPEDPELYEDNTCDTIEVTKDFVKLTEELEAEYLRLKEMYKQQIKEQIKEASNDKPT